RLPVAEFMVIFLLENGFGPQTPLGLHELIKSEILKNPKVSEVVLREFKECEETSDIKKLVEFARRKFSDQSLYSDALYTIGRMYEDGILVDSDKEKAQSYYMQAAEQGHEEAIAKLAEFQTM